MELLEVVVLLALLAEAGCGKRSQPGFLPGFVFSVTDPSPAGSARRENELTLFVVHQNPPSPSPVHNSAEFTNLFPYFPWQDHFVQDPAVLRERAEARRQAHLARKG